MFNGMHPLFLMALLRVSDYLQIQAERAPTYSLSFEANREPKGLALPGLFRKFLRRLEVTLCASLWREFLGIPKNPKEFLLAVSG